MLFGRCLRTSVVIKHNTGHFFNFRLRWMDLFKNCVIDGESVSRKNTPARQLENNYAFWLFVLAQL